MYLYNLPISYNKINSIGNNSRALKNKIACLFKGIVVSCDMHMGPKL